MTKRVTFTIAGNTYVYPDGPSYPDLRVRFNSDGTIRVMHGVDPSLPGSMVESYPHAVPPYHVKIEDDALGVVYEKDHPTMWWWTAWTYRPKPLVAIRTPAQLVAARRAFPMGDMGCDVGAANYIPYANPGDFSNITPSMPTTGERPDLGFLHNLAAHYMLGGSPLGMFGWAQASMSNPIHFYDPATGKYPSQVTYPKLNSYTPRERQGKPWVAAGVRDADGKIQRGGITPQKAHHPGLAGLAALASEDLNCIEDAQDEAKWLGTCEIAGDNPLMPRPCVTVSEQRGMAWHFRSLLHAYVVTLDLEKRCADAGIPFPSHLESSATFKKMIDNTRLYWEAQWMNNPAYADYHNLCGSSTQFSPWQHNYVMTVVPYALLIGLREFEALYLWSLRLTLDQLKGGNGYPPGFGLCYYTNTKPFLPLDPTIAAMPEGTAEEIKAKDAKLEAWYGSNDKVDKTAPSLTWQEIVHSWIITHPVDTKHSGKYGHTQITQAQYDALMADPLNGGKAMKGGDYQMNQWAAMAMASYLDTNGWANVRGTYLEFDACLKTCKIMVNNHGDINLRASYATIANGPAVALPPLTVVGQSPPPTEPGPTPTPTPPPVIVFSPVPPPPLGLIPINPTPDDIYDLSAVASAFIVPKEAPNGVNVIGDGGTVAHWKITSYPTHVRFKGWTADGGAIWVEFHGSGKTMVTYGCAGVVIGSTGLQMPPPYQFPQEPTDPPTGEIIVTDPVFNAPFTATAVFKDNLGSVVVPDTVVWEAPAQFNLSQDVADKLKAHGVYGVEGVQVIKITGVKGGVTLIGTKEVTVPAPVPFLAEVEITLS